MHMHPTITSVVKICFLIFKFFPNKLQINSIQVKQPGIINMFFTRDYPTVLNGKITFKILNDSRPDSMLIEHSYDYFTD